MGFLKNIFSRKKNELNELNEKLFGPETLSPPEEDDVEKDILIEELESLVVELQESLQEAYNREERYAQMLQEANDINSRLATIGEELSELDGSYQKAVETNKKSLQFADVFNRGLLIVLSQYLGNVFHLNASAFKDIVPTKHISVSDSPETPGMIMISVEESEDVN